MIRFEDFFDLEYPEKTKVKFNMNAGDVNLRAWDYLVNGEEDTDWIQMNSWKTKHANNNLNNISWLLHSTIPMALIIIFLEVCIRWKRLYRRSLINQDISLRCSLILRIIERD